MKHARIKNFDTAVFHLSEKAKEVLENGLGGYLHGLYGVNNFSSLLNDDGLMSLDEMRINPDEMKNIKTLEEKYEKLLVIKELLDFVVRNCNVDNFFQNDKYGDSYGKRHQEYFREYYKDVDLEQIKKKKDSGEMLRVKSPVDRIEEYINKYNASYSTKAPIDQSYASKIYGHIVEKWMESFLHESYFKVELRNRIKKYFKLRNFMADDNCHKPDNLYKDNNHLFLFLVEDTVSFIFKESKLEKEEIVKNMNGLFKGSQYEKQLNFRVEEEAKRC
ncbi:hypothetical protein KJ855_02505 [Patescibacteria group bacterium]|nr:hypothetical protein [Patescibacteria group bacterium]